MTDAEKDDIGGSTDAEPGYRTKGCAPLGSQTWVEGARCDDDGLGVMGESFQTIDPSPQGERDPSALPTRGCSLASMLRPLVLPPGLRVCLSLVVEMQGKVAIFHSIWTCCHQFRHHPQHWTKDRGRHAPRGNHDDGAPPTLIIDESNTILGDLVRTGPKDLRRSERPCARRGRFRRNMK